jgi:polysaccharide deacetylase 2 family uncharacterized protein YibQ
MPYKSKGRSQRKQVRGGKRKRSSLRKWKLSPQILILVSIVSIFFLLFHDNIRSALSYKKRKLSVSEIARTIDTLNERIAQVFSLKKIEEKGVGISFSVQEKGDNIFIVPQQKEFILPAGFSQAELYKTLHDITDGFDYEIAIRDTGKDHSAFRVRIDIKTYPTHNFTFFYPVTESTRKYRVAIVIDDLGFNIERARELLNLNVSLSFAVLPYVTYSTDIADEAYARGRDVLLHLPMEPIDYPEKDPGEGAIFLAMSDEEVSDRVKKGIEAVPHIIGVNNHMGSKFSENSDKMKVVLNALRENNLFFLDSKTSPQTTGFRAAKEMGLQVLDRQVFLDNEQDVENTIAKFEELIEIAKERGSAVAIGHPHPTTIAALKKMIDRFESEGVEVVPVSSLIE